MLLVHTETGGGNELLFRAETVGNDGSPRVLQGDELRAAIGDEICGGAMPPLAPGRVDAAIPPWPQTLAFLFSVRGRKIRHGVFLSEASRAAIGDFRAAVRMVAAGRVLPWLEKRGGRFAAVWRPLETCTAFAAECADRIARSAGRTVLETEGRAETADDAWLAALRSDDPFLPDVWSGDAEDLARRIRDWCAPLAERSGGRGSLKFALVPPDRYGGRWSIAYNPPSTRNGLVSLGQAIRLFPPIGTDDFRKEDAEAFLRSGAGILEAAGFQTEIPEGMRAEHIAVEAELSPADGAAGTDAAGRIRDDAKVAAKITVRVDGETVGEDEIQFLLDQGSTLVFFRNRWIEVDRNILKEALRALRDSGKRKLAAKEALSLMYGIQSSGRGLKISAVHARGWFDGLVRKLSGGIGDAGAAPVPAGFAGTLRDYQRRGFAWMSMLCELGFGPCLADDMGLGKTVQTIAWALRRKETGAAAAGPLLVVAPVSVAINWMKEFKRFAPGLKTVLHHGSGRAHGSDLHLQCRRADVVVTGYPLVVRDFADLKGVRFSAIALDEAQMVKNPDTHVAKAVRALGVPVRLALTGTPVENSAFDIWSLQDFLNPGLFGTRKDFERAFARDLGAAEASGNAASAASRLRRALSPFVLRRLKSAPEIAAELGGKREIREYCALSDAQRRDYEDALRRFGSEVADDPSGRSRRGRMLALLTELKLVCDGDGKTARLADLLHEIFESGESAIVFTQYVKVAKRLRAYLADVFGVRFPFLHGGLSPAEREREIGDFNSSAEPTAFLVSLKAGGFGLNLVKATHVVHFDRWWNPAVENQATDRAHRIGQTKTVFVHLFISPGTLEERIDALLEGKRRLAGGVVASGEAILAGMSPEEFERTVALS